MSTVAIIASGAVSAAGVGRTAYGVGGRDTRPGTSVKHSDWLQRAGLRRPVAALVDTLCRAEPGADYCAEPASQLLEVAFRELCERLDSARPGWREERLGLCVGTSSGGMTTQLVAAERLEFGSTIPPEMARETPYFAPFRALIRNSTLKFGPTAHILGACASSTFAIGLGCRWVQLDLAELVIAGGYDAVTLMVAAGFEALAATSASRPRPFCATRDGLCLGDGAALVALARQATPSTARSFAVLGFGASADAHHPTAPEPQGHGLLLAAQRALRDAGMTSSDIHLVSAHGTATRYNDAAEIEVLRALALEAVPIHPLKAVTGHTLGAAGALETLAVMDAAEQHLLPAAAIPEPAEPAIAGRLLGRNQTGEPLPTLKLSSAFGGANAALVLGESRAGHPRKPRPVALLTFGEAVSVPDPVKVRDSGARIDHDRLIRLDELSSLALTAVAFAKDLQVPTALDADRVGIVLGTAAATIEANAAFDSRRRRRGCQLVEPRKFPATTPNLAAGYISMAFGWRGPNIAVCGGLAAPLEALLVAFDLVAAGDAEHCWVIVADVVGEHVSAFWSAAGWLAPAPGALAALLGPGSDVGAGRLDRPALHALFEKCERGQGQLSDARPGWTVLQSAIEELTGGNTPACSR